MFLTAIGVYVGLLVLANYSQFFILTFIPALIAEIALMFVASRVAERAQNLIALPLLAFYSLISGFTLSGIIYYALNTEGVGVEGIGIAAFGCAITFCLAKDIGSNMSGKDGLALTKTIQLGILALLVVIILQLIFALFGIFTPSWLEVGISGIGIILFVATSFVDFYILPRTYRDNQYLSVALSMYLTYINLFIFILRLLIALNKKN